MALFGVDGTTIGEATAVLGRDVTGEAPMVEESGMKGLENVKLG